MSRTYFSIASAFFFSLTASAVFANPRSPDKAIFLAEEHVLISVGKEFGAVDGQFNFMSSKERSLSKENIIMLPIYASKQPENITEAKAVSKIKMKALATASSLSVISGEPEELKSLWRPQGQHMVWYVLHISDAWKDETEARTVDKETSKVPGAQIRWINHGDKTLIIEASYLQETYVEGEKSFFAYLPIIPEKNLYGDYALNRKRKNFQGEIQLDPEPGYTLKLVSDYPAENVKKSKTGLIVTPIDQKPIIVEVVPAK